MMFYVLSRQSVPGTFLHTHNRSLFEEVAEKVSTALKIPQPEIAGLKYPRFNQERDKINGRFRWIFKNISKNMYDRAHGFVFIDIPKNIQKIKSMCNKIGFKIIETTIRNLDVLITVPNSDKKDVYQVFQNSSGLLRSEFLRWEYEPKNAKKWIEKIIEHPGMLISRPHAAARLGITEGSFEKIYNTKLSEYRCDWVDGEFYYAALLDQFYSDLLGGDINESLTVSNEKVASVLGVDAASCIVCKKGGVHTICDQCQQPVDPEHVETTTAKRPLLFQPEQICWKCLYKNRNKYNLMAGKERLEEIFAEIEKTGLLQNESMEA